MHVCTNISDTQFVMQELLRNPTKVYVGLCVQTYMISKDEVDRQVRLYVSERSKVLNQDPYDARVLKHSTFVNDTDPSQVTLCACFE